MQHIEIPNDLITTNEIEPKDLVIYLALKSFDGDECYPGLRKLSELSGASVSVVRKCLTNLEKHEWIEIIHGERGQKTYYKFKKYIEFEPFSYEFLKRKDMSFIEKAYYISQQQYLYKNSEHEGTTSLPIQTISKNINMPISTIYKCEKSLKEKGYLEIYKSNEIDPETGCKKSIRYFDMAKFGQAIAYTLRHQQEQINNIEDRQNKTDDRVALLEKKLDIVMNENAELKKKLEQPNLNMTL